MKKLFLSLILALMLVIPAVSYSSSSAYLGLYFTSSSTFSATANTSYFTAKCVSVDYYGKLDVQFYWDAYYWVFYPYNAWYATCGSSSQCWIAAGSYIDTYTGQYCEYDSCGNYWCDDSYYGGCYYDQYYGYICVN